MSKKIIFLFLALLACLCLSANAESVTVTDMFGREMTIAGPVTRIVATEPSDCEILYALGCSELLVGRGLYCDYPAQVLSLPAVQSGANTNLEEILSLSPQVVIMGDMAHSVDQVHQLEACGIPVVTTNADSIAEVYDSIRLLGQVTGKNAEAETLIESMQATFDSIAKRSETSGKTIYFEVMPLEWGLWTAGSNTFMYELAEMCGMKNAFADLDGWQPISQEQVIARNPDYIVLVTGMDDSAVQEVLGRAGWQDIAAIQKGLVYNADSYTLTRPAPRLTEAAESLWQFLYGNN